MIRSLFAGFVLAALPVFADAVVLTVEYDTSVSSAYNWGTGAMQSIAPITGSGSFTYDLGGKPTAQYWGTSVGAVFAGQSNLLGLTSPGVASVPFDPRTMSVEVNQLRAVLDNGSWSNQTLMAELNTVGWDAVSGSSVYYNWGLTYSDYEWAGDSAYLLSAQDIIDSYRNLAISGAAVSVQEGFSFWQGSVMSGLTWTDNNARITRVLVDGRDIMLAAASVPAPSTYALLLPGLVLLGATIRRRKAASGVAR